MSHRRRMGAGRIALLLAAGVVLASLLTAPASAARVPGATGTVAAAGPEQLTPAQQQWQDQVIYLVMVDRFKNGDKSNDGDARPGDPSWHHGGDIQGVIDQLPYLKDLGVTAIWVTPLVQNEAGGYHGYWANDFNAVEPRLGTWDKTKELTDKAHGLGMKVLLDMVVNHTGYKHPWLADASKQDWFHPRAEINFNVQDSVEKGWLAGLPDLNTENPAVQQYLVEMSKNWLIKGGFDGFRMDTARHVPKDFWQNVYIPALKQAKPDFWMVGEVWETQKYDYLGQYQTAGFDAVFDFPLYQAIDEVFGHDAGIGKLTGMNNLAQKFTPRPSQLVSFIDNHDVKRFHTAAKDNRTPREKEALTFLLTYKDIPMLYYGTEIAMDGGADPNNRADMMWTPDGKPAQEPAVFDLTKQLIALRKEHAALRRGSYTELLDAGAALAFGRVYQQDTVVTVINNADKVLAQPVPVTEINWPDGTVLQEVLTGTKVAVQGGQFLPTTPARTGQVWVLAPSGLRAIGQTLGTGGAGAAAAALALIGLGGWYFWRRGRGDRGGFNPYRPGDRR